MRCKKVGVTFTNHRIVRPESVSTVSTTDVEDVGRVAELVEAVGVEPRFVIPAPAYAGVNCGGDPFSGGLPATRFTVGV
jgi:hypothetical protein